MIALKSKYITLKSVECIHFVRSGKVRLYKRFLYVSRMWYLTFMKHTFAMVMN